MFVDNAKIMAKRLAAIPKDSCEVLGVGSSGRIAFIVEGNTIPCLLRTRYSPGGQHVFSS